MKEVVNSKKKFKNSAFRFVYGLFLLLVIYLLIKGDLESAVINLGIALVFDPFDQEVLWNNRPLYQRAWMLVHVSLVFAGFVALLLK